jgi:hypothetical protein
MRKGLLLIILTGMFLLAACTSGNSQPGTPTAISPEKATETQQPKNTDVPTAVPPTETPKAVVPPVIKMETKQYQEDQVLPPVSIKAEYPNLIEPAGDQLFNEQVKKEVDAQILDLKKQAADVEDWRAKTEPSFSSGLIVKYGVGTTEKGFASVRLEISPYFAGAAHPNFFYIVINYDVVNQKFLKLSDLFKPGSNYIEKIAAYCKQDLLKQGIQDFFPEGILPKEENFSNWNLTNDGLQILFNPYQVTPWVMGPQKVTIPYTELQYISLPSGPLEVFTK